MSASATDAWPGDPAQVAAWVRAQLHAAVTENRGIDRAMIDALRIEVVLDGDDVTFARIEATDAVLRWPDPPAQADQPAHADLPAPGGAAGAERASAPAHSGDGSHGDDDGQTGSDLEPEPQPQPQPMETRPGTLRELHVIADPARFEQWPVWLEVRAQDLPIVWRRFPAPLDPAAPDTDRDVVPADDNAIPAASFTAAIERADLEPMLRAVAEAALADTPLRVHHLDADLRGTSQHDLTFDVGIGLRLGVLPLSARASARAGIDADGVLELRALTVRSRNPLIALALLVPPVRRHLAGLAPRTFLLAELFTDDGPDATAPARTPTAAPPLAGEPAAHLRDLRVELGSRIRISGRLEPHR